MKKLFLCLLSLVLSSCLLGGCVVSMAPPLPAINPLPPAGTVA